MTVLDIPIGMVIQIRKLGHHSFRAVADERNPQAALHAAVGNWWRVVEGTEVRFQRPELRRLLAEAKPGT